jgi:putative Holliday junction resolvase
VKVLAVDLGTKRTGFAVSDAAGRLALALPTIEDAGAVDAARLAEEHGADLIVVGLPLNMSGTEGPAARRTRDFIEELRIVSALPVEAWDERLSTVEGEARLREAGLDRRARASRKDVAAAIVILESYLRFRREGEGAGPPP